MQFHCLQPKDLNEIGIAQLCRTAYKTKTMSKSVKPFLNLKQFMLRQEVLSLYRTIYRTINKIPDEGSRVELKTWLREDFRKNKLQTEEIQIKMSIQVGLRSLKELQNSLELSGISCDKKS